MENSEYQLRKHAVMYTLKGKTLQETADLMGQSKSWVGKWYTRYRQEGWQGLRTHSRAPNHSPHQTSEATKLAIHTARLELEARRGLSNTLHHIGARAIRTYLKEQNHPHLPSVPTIERILRERQLTRPKKEASTEVVQHPHLRPTQPYQLVQVDIVPHFLKGGQRVACFNAIDVVSRYLTGQASLTRQARDGVAFLTHVWQEIGIPAYTQVDNEGCFSGGATHPYVLGQVVRAALRVGTELLFSPCYHPQSNGFVERSHQEYNRHVWQESYLADLDAVNEMANRFFPLYRNYANHKQLAGQTPHQVHAQGTGQKLTAQQASQLLNIRLPLYAGRVHFMRRVNQGVVRVLNVDWSVPHHHDPCQGVWGTLDLQPEQATLSIFDAPPDDAQRQLLVAYPFPVKEPILPWESLPPLATVDLGSDYQVVTVIETCAPEAVTVETVCSPDDQKTRSTVAVAVPSMAEKTSTAIVRTPHFHDVVMVHPLLKPFLFSTMS